MYGFDIMGWPGYPVIRSVREFLMVTWIIQRAPESKEAAAEARKRISRPAHRNKPQGLAAFCSTQCKQAVEPPWRGCFLTGL